MENQNCPCKRNVGTMLEVLAVIVVLQAAKTIAEGIVRPSLPDTRFADKMLTLAVMAALSAAVIFYAKLRRQPLSVFPQKFSKWHITATAAAAVLMIATPSNYTGGYQAILVLVYGSIVTPVYEELLFRGLVWNRLEKRFRGKYTAYILTAALFGLWHIGYMIPQLLAGNWFAVVTKVAIGLVYGFVLGFVRQKTKNCYSTMLLHGVMNLFAF